ncbi:unnamed protein product [Anisakis simplex]|uniref:IMS_C domain-containing protein n=1 Tax=Anisakis simplex TaxID=6269 RepID=A0A0M3JG71_ANISI|nr:unnamed protein product [Anisakis simplex]
MLEMGAVYLPVTENWRKFYVNCERDASNQNQYAAHGVIRIAKELSENLLQSERFVQGSGSQTLVFCSQL